ncbi:MAG: hypothetical protein Athens071416_288 [Parcubacteria group bacterium Athens0714_16]|nr:MAG: hypothetical protein Athens071416_288 [Parcubacteria group bacterium Athens0714_16]
MKKFKKRICGVCGNTVLSHNDGTAITHSRIDGAGVVYHDDTTCAGGGKKTHLRMAKWVFIATSIIGSALIVGVKYNHDKAKVLKIS